MKYLGGRGARGLYKFFKKKFVAQETVDIIIPWPSNFFGKYFMAPLINFSSSTHSNIQISNHLRS